MKRFIVGVTGASGSIYGVRLIEALLADPGRQVHLIISPAGARVMATELPAGQKFSAGKPATWLQLT